MTKGNSIKQVLHTILSQIEPETIQELYSKIKYMSPERIGKIFKETVKEQKEEIDLIGI